ncbi:MAG: hypothetical protein ACXVZV_00685 [Terriglobales bacterium]
MAERDSEEQASKAASEIPADSTRTRSTTQSVAFRVIAVIEDATVGRTPVWGACPLTEQEESILRELSDRDKLKGTGK